MNIRFFAYALVQDNEDPDLYIDDIVEITEACFCTFQRYEDVKVKYERHTVFENGVNQVCLTIENTYDIFLAEDLELV